MMSGPRILIANERFLARFGVDRILVLLGRRLAAEGASVSFACLRADREKLAGISQDVDLVSLPDGLNLGDTETFVADHLSAAWSANPIDVIISGGWPFFTAAARAGAVGIRSVFIDAGAVPHDGFSPEIENIQRELRRIRQLTLPAIETVLPISRFIQDTQTLPDRGNERGVHTVLLGADHLAELPHGEEPELSLPEMAILAELDGRVAAGAVPVLSLGRAESGGYKNTGGALSVFRRIREADGRAHLLLLVGPDEFPLPDDLSAHVTPLRTLSDAALVAVMERCVLGISSSLWEGFNLPVAEMQWLGRPALAFAAGAHPEIIADPWFLCTSEGEMVRKAVEILRDGVPEPIKARGRFDRFRARFPWKRTLDSWAHVVVPKDLPPRATIEAPARRLVLMDVTNSARDPANSGVIRVTRRLASELAKMRDLDLVLVIWNWDKKAYELPRPENLQFLSSNAGPDDWLGQVSTLLGKDRSVEDVLKSVDPRTSLRPVLFMPEVALDGSASDRIAWAESRHFRTGVVFYDMLPIDQKAYVDPNVVAAFPGYLAAIARSDALFAISGFSLNSYERYHGERGSDVPARRAAVWLPSQFSDYRRVSGPQPEQDEIRILCVSTIEPRKNHRLLIAAFQDARTRRPDLPMRLDLVGNSYAGAEDLAAWVRSAAEADDRLVWHGILPDHAIAEAYAQTSFTVYPSIAEGFGLPIMESLWMGRPCICHEGGVMAELAAGGGCLTVDVENVRELSAAIEEMAQNRALRDALTRQAQSRPIESWEEYSRTIADHLRRV